MKKRVLTLETGEDFEMRDTERWGTRVSLYIHSIAISSFRLRYVSCHIDSSFESHGRQHVEGLLMSRTLPYLPVE